MIKVSNLKSTYLGRNYSLKSTSNLRPNRPKLYAKELQLSTNSNLPKFQQHRPKLKNSKWAKYFCTKFKTYKLSRHQTTWSPACLPELCSLISVSFAVPILPCLIQFSDVYVCRAQRLQNVYVTGYKWLAHFLPRVLPDRHALCVLLRDYHSCARSRIVLMPWIFGNASCCPTMRVNFWPTCACVYLPAVFWARDLFLIRV
jgi:hypothetical protein